MSYDLNGRSYAVEKTGISRGWQKPSTDFLVRSTKKGLLKTGFDNFGLAVLYRYVDFETEKDQDILDWSANMTFDGPSVFVTANF